MKKILILLLLIPFISRAQNPHEIHSPQAFYQTVSYPNLSASLPLKLNAAKQVTAAKILIGECDTTLSVNGVIGYPRFWKMRDSLLALISAGGSVPGSSGQLIWNNGGSLAGTGSITTNGSYINAVGLAANGTRNYTGTTIGLSVSGGRGALDAYNASGAAYVGIDYFALDHNFKISTTEKMKIAAAGVSIGGVAATSYLTLGAGTSTAGTAPLKFTAGTLLSAVENGAVEYDATHVYITIGGVRYQLDQQSGGGVTSITGTSNQISANTPTGAIILSTPQNIHTAATPQFLSLGLGAAASASTALLLPASTTSLSSLRITSSGSIPSSPVDGDIFRSGSAGLRFYNGSESKRLDNGYSIQGASDANQTISFGYTMIELPTITANRTVTLPSGAVGDEVIIWVSNSAGFTWSIAGTPTANDAAGASITTLTNDTVYKFVCYATNNWLRIN